ncbi:MAG: hypothetical protein Q4D17_03950 [Planctomycetia bacterium]|nr:hypothetical protein [Planctomycetia bacterium]
MSGKNGSVNFFLAGNAVNLVQTVERSNDVLRGNGRDERDAAGGWFQGTDF